MKKFIVLICSAAVLNSMGQTGETGWKIGLQFGIAGNDSRFSGGMEDANGRFRQNSFGAPNLTFLGRYDYNRHWAIEGGIGITAFGFDYSISENYSFIRDKDKVSSIQTSFAALELPVDVFYKFNLNCRNVRWVVSAGLAPTFREQQTVNTDFSVTTEGTSTKYLSSTSDFSNSKFVLLRYSVGREKVFKCGSLLRVSLHVNLGLNTIATSTVKYRVDNTDYVHTFKNDGSSVGIRFSYFLMTHRNPYKLTPIQQ